MKVTMFHLMPYPRLPDEVIAPTTAIGYHAQHHYDPKVGHATYSRYLDQLELCDDLGFDGVAVNEHHQTPYGMMPSPIVMASALARRTKQLQDRDPRQRILPARHPLTLAEEHAMIDNITGGRLITGFVRGVGAEYSVVRRQSRAVARAPPRGARSRRAGVDEARAVRLRGQALSLRIRERVAAALPAAASADLVPVARLERNDRMGGASRPQISLSAELQSVQRGGEISQLLSGSRADPLRLRRDLRPDRLRRACLRRRDRRAGDERGARAARVPVQQGFKMPTGMFFPPGYTSRRR